MRRKKLLFAADKLALADPRRLRRRRCVLPGSKCQERRPARPFAGFRTAAAKLKAEDQASPFPIGSFPPALPFVTT
jgi:hypothetical protein